MSSTATHTVNHTAQRPAARFSARAAAVFFSGLSFVVLVLSGLGLLIAPSGRIATQIDWSLLGLGRVEWEMVHLSVGLLFVGVGLWHIALHRAVIRNLVWSCSAQALCHRRELALAIGVVAAVVLLAAFALPPVSWLEQLSGWFKRDFW